VAADPVKTGTAGSLCQRLKSGGETAKSGPVLAAPAAPAQLHRFFFGFSRAVIRCFPRGLSFSVYGIPGETRGALRFREIFPVRFFWFFAAGVFGGNHQRFFRDSSRNWRVSPEELSENLT